MQTVLVPVDAGQYKKQDVLVSDSTGIATVTLWEENIGDLQEDSCYRLENFVIKEYASKQYIIMSRSNSYIKPIPDIGLVQGGRETDEKNYHLTQPTVNHL